MAVFSTSPARTRVLVGAPIPPLPPTENGKLRFKNHNISTSIEPKKLEMSTTTTLDKEGASVATTAKEELARVVAAWAVAGFLSSSRPHKLYQAKDEEILGGGHGHLVYSRFLCQTLMLMRTCKVKVRLIAIESTLPMIVSRDSGSTRQLALFTITQVIIKVKMIPYKVIDFFISSQCENTFPP